MICIYCLEEKDISHYMKAEHVIPQSFGLFDNNFTLNKIVCDECNKFFGDNLEICLARDTVEGLLRFDYFKEPRDYKDLGRRSKLKVTTREKQPFTGLRVFHNKIEATLAPQVGFLNKKTNSYHFFLLDDIPSKGTLIENDFDMNNKEGLIILNCDIETAKKKLNESGITDVFYEQRKEVRGCNDDVLRCKIEREFDDIVIRTLAKIGFNYLAYWQGRDFMLNSSFDKIRDYIRKGIKPDYQLTRITRAPILEDEPIDGKKRLGHIVTINYAQNNSAIMAQISLMNRVTFLVFLAKTYKGINARIKVIHFR